MPDFTLQLPGNIPLDMVFVQGNDAPGDRDFMMGGSDIEAGNDENPVHPVCLYSFFIGRHPVTQAQWKAVMGADNNPSGFKGDRRPVENVSWFDAVVFCNKLSELTQKEACYYSDLGFKTPFGKIHAGWKLPNKGVVFIKYSAGGYRLPTEAEWEYAARGGSFFVSEGYRYAGSDLLEQVGWYDKNSAGETRDVGLLLPNALGLCDMSGNLWEWCSDWYGEKYYLECLQKDTVENPTGPATGSSRVYRGGSYFNEAPYCRSTHRGNRAPGDRSNYRGFRPLLSFQADG